MKVAIVTMFNGLSTVYSLVNVVADQLQMLLDANISVKLFVSEHCPDGERTGIFADERIEWIKIINSDNDKAFHWRNYFSHELIHDSFFREAELISEDFQKHLADVDVCLLHDILYQGLHLVHNVAIRMAQEKLPSLRFLAFTHSAPVPHREEAYPKSCLYSPMPNTRYIYPSWSGIHMLMGQYGLSESDCACVSNSINPLQGVTEQTRKINEAMDLCRKEILIVYPARMSMAKGLHLLSEFTGTIKRVSGKSVGLIFCDFPSGERCPLIYRQMITDVGVKAGLAPEDILFTTDIGFPQGVARETVYHLFTLSNLFICPSFSESFGLIVLEAASRGNYVVVNEAVLALKELGETLGAHQMCWAARNFDKVSFPNYEPSEQEYFEMQTRFYGLKP
ncbi:MAG: glycosyltransferase [Clostridia bacterium]